MSNDNDYYLKEISGRFWNYIERFKDAWKLRTSDVFFGYFLTFEILYNWKFLTTIFKEGSPDEVKATISYAENYIILPRFL